MGVWVCIPPPPLFVCLCLSLLLIPPVVFCAAPPPRLLLQCPRNVSVCLNQPVLELDILQIIRFMSCVAPKYIHLTVLPPMRRRETEDYQAFADRVCVCVCVCVCMCVCVCVYVCVCVCCS